MMTERRSALVLDPKASSPSMTSKEQTRDSDRGLTVVRERYSSLNQLIGDLSLKLSEVSSSIDNEFLSAYRVHMVDVQEDLKSLKMQVATAESALHDDSAVSTLETEVNWFSDETSRLRSHAMSMRKDMHHILSRIDALNEQRHFLNDQLKQVLKRSKVLESEIDGTINMSTADRSTSDRRTSHDENDYNNTTGPATYSEVSRSNDMEDEQYYEPAHTHSTPFNSNKESISFKSMRLRKVQSAPHAVQRPQIVRDALISKTPVKTQGESSATRKDPGYQLELLLSLKSAEESILEREIEIVYREILTRKKDEKVRNTTSSRSARRVVEVETEEEVEQQCRRKGGVTGLGLDLFSDEDRLKAVMSFLQHPAAFEKVVQVLAMNYAGIGLDQS